MERRPEAAPLRSRPFRRIRLRIGSFCGIILEPRSAGRKRPGNGLGTTASAPRSHCICRHIISGKDVMLMEKFVPRDKMSKKAKKKLDAEKRAAWAFSPVTRKVESKKSTTAKGSPGPNTMSAQGIFFHSVSSPVSRRPENLQLHSAITQKNHLTNTVNLHAGFLRSFFLP